jgi:hypothetical protein
MSNTALSGASENRQTELRLEGKARRVFTQSGWNKVLREAGIFAGNWWIGNYGVLRWNAGYAQGTLGYRPAAAKRKRMARGEAPFFSSGQFMAGFNSRARTEATAKKGHATFYVVVPAGYLNFHPDQVRTFRRIPQREAAAVAREFRRAVIQGVMQGRAAHAAKVQAKAGARLAKKQASAARRAEKRAARSTRTQRATRRAAE